VPSAKDFVSRYEARYGEIGSFSAYGYDAIKNLLKAAITESNQSEEDKVSGIKLIDKVHDKSNLRNNIAHNSWKPGRREGSIKPLVLKTKGSVLMLGTGHNEKDWTAKELHSEAEEILARVIRVADFFADRGITISAEDAND